MVFETAVKIIQSFTNEGKRQGDYLKIMEEVSELFNNIIAGAEMFNAYVKRRYGYDLDLGIQMDALPFAFIQQMSTPLINTNDIK